MKGLTDQATFFRFWVVLCSIRLRSGLNDRYYKGKEFVIETRNNSKTK